MKALQYRADFYTGDSMQERLLQLRDYISCAAIAVLATAVIFFGSWFYTSGSVSVPFQSTRIALTDRAAPFHLVLKPGTRTERIAPTKPGPIYTVRQGDYLSTIAQKVYGKSAAWPVIYWANRSLIHNANLIYPGQRLGLPAMPSRIPTAPSPTSSSAHASSAPVTHYQCGDGDGDGYDIPCSQLHPVTHHTAHSAPAPDALTAPTSSGGYSVSSAFQACVIRAESGGNPNIWNASGHWGLYQFSASTWAGHGGDPSLFGHAGAAYQTQIFWNTVHQDGTSDWAPYDGC